MAQLGFIPLIAAAIPFVAPAIGKAFGKLRKKKKRAPAEAPATAAASVVPPPPVAAGLPATAAPRPMMVRRAPREAEIGGVPVKYLILGGAALAAVVLLTRQR